MSVLDPLADWPVDHFGAVVMAPGGTWQAGEMDRVFELASVTKLLAAYAVLIAVEEGAVELDQPAGPQGSTVRHLLAHASGLGFAHGDPVRPVGQRRVYSSAGFEALATHVEQATGLGFAQYLHEAVTEPLGMGNTQLYGSAGHGARSTGADMAAFVGELREPRLLDSSTLAEAWSVQWPQLRGVVPGYGMHKPCPWGLGFEIRGNKDPHWTGPAMPAETVGHFGMSGTYLWLDPGSGAAMVALTDREFGPWAREAWAPLNQQVWEAVSGGGASTSEANP